MVQVPKDSAIDKLIKGKSDSELLEIVVDIIEDEQLVAWDSQGGNLEVLRAIVKYIENTPRSQRPNYTVFRDPVTESPFKLDSLTGTSGAYFNETS